MEAFFRFIRRWLFTRPTAVGLWIYHVRNRPQLVTDWRERMQAAIYQETGELTLDGDNAVFLVPNNNAGTVAVEWVMCNIRGETVPLHSATFNHPREAYAAYTAWCTFCLDPKNKASFKHPAAATKRMPPNPKG